MNACFKCSLVELNLNLVRRNEPFSFFAKSRKSSGSCGIHKLQMEKPCKRFVLIRVH